MTPLIGRTLAHYRMTAAIGAGGMGEVYRATDTTLGREVALKVLPAGMAASPERLERLLLPVPVGENTKTTDHVMTNWTSLLK
jgi:serine/threonine protein kinase